MTELSSTYEESSELLHAARRAWLAAASLYANVDNAEVEAGIHVLRGWFAVAQVHAVLRGESCGDEASLAPVDRDKLKFSDKLSREKWDAQLEALSAELQRVPARSHREGVPSLSDIGRHCDLLESHIDELTRELRHHFGIKLFSRQAIKRQLIRFGIVLGVCLIGWLSFRVYQGPTLWQAEFYRNPKLRGKPEKVFEHRKIDFNWDASAPFPGFKRDRFSARWTTCLELDEPREVRFILGSDDGSRLKLNSKKILDFWGPHGYSTKRKDVKVDAGKHLLQLEYNELGGGARVSLTAEDPVRHDQILVRKYLELPKMDGKSAVCK